MLGGKDANRKDSLMRLPITALAVAALSLALAAPASAKKSDPQPQPQPVYSFIATIDCGAGPVQVGSTDDLYAPLVDLKSGREYEPVAWDVQVGDNRFQDALPGASLRHTVDCSYDDGVAKGTVTVKRARCQGDRDDDDRGDRGHRGRHHGHDWDRNRH
jgi:hypothetical protein